MLRWHVARFVVVHLYCPQSIDVVEIQVLQQFWRLRLWHKVSFAGAAYIIVQACQLQCWCELP